MGNTVKIYVQNPKNSIPSRFFDGGRLSFDVPQDFDFSETITPEKLDALQQLQANYAISSSLRKTDKNSSIFAAFGKTKIGIIVMANSRVLEFSAMYLLGDNNLEYEIRYESSAPLIMLKTALLKDLNLGDFDYSEANCLLSFANDLTDESKAAYHPVVNFGAWVDTAPTDKTVKIEDLRPFFKEYYLLKQIFCQFTNYQFISEVHEKGTIYADYILGSEFSGVEFGAKAVQSVEVTFSGTLNSVYSSAITLLEYLDNISPSQTYTSLVTEIGYDNGVTVGGYYNNAMRFSTISGVHKIKFSLWLKTALSNNSDDFDWGVAVEIVKNAVVIETLYIEASTDFELYNFETQEFTVIGTDQIDVVIKSAVFTQILQPTYPHDITIGRVSYFELIAINVYPTDGYVEKLNKFVDKKLKCIDFVKGVVHAFNANLHIDRASQKIYLLPETSVSNLFGTGLSVQGYNTDKHVDLRGLIVCKSEQKSDLSDDLNRYHIFKYKDSTDPALEQNKNLAQQSVDLGDSYKNETTTNENPFFEPTASEYNTQLFSGGRRYPISKITDNNENKKSVNIVPRRVILQNEIPFGTIGTSSNLFWSFNGITQNNNMPTCYMFPQVPYGSVNAQTTNENVCYGGVAYSIYKTFYEKSIQKLSEGQSINFLIWMNDVFYQRISLRDTFILQTDGKPFLAKIKVIKDYKIGRNIATPIEFTKLTVRYDC